MKNNVLFKQVTFHSNRNTTSKGLQKIDFSNPYARSYLLRKISIRAEKSSSPAKIFTVKVLSVRDMLLNLRENGLSVSALADIMRVERKTIYAWSSGSTVKPDNEIRLEKIYKLLNEEKCASFRSLSRYFNKNIHGKTIKNLLQEDTVDEKAIQKILKIIWPLAQKTEKELQFNNSNSTSNPIHDAMGEVFFQ